MSILSQEELNELVLNAKKFTKQGKLADYIPALLNANRDDLSIAIYHPDGECVSAGDTSDKMTLQSISKVLTLAYALIDCGEDYVFSKVGYEPTGDPFNSIIKLEINNPSKPLNPMINAGALAVAHMIYGNTVLDRFNKILSFVRELSGNSKVTYSEEVAKSEFETSFLNRSLCYYMKQHGVIDEKVEDLMDLYTKICAIEVDCFDLARIGIVFAMNGIDPVTNRRIIPEEVARICKTFMVTCGMYNASGEFAIRVGIPAKSGVSGGIMGAIPHRYGLGILGPALDERGNSVAGLKLLEMLSSKYSLSMF
ncbi:glutaminase A [Peribacillus alkalitolerans]|uniref:glutaminase A n=1 Tax=Peribacillus alkalitolerans TaxID=1550385 RepID=UPI00196757B0|nr:glutaminase A [Peribacillus alkalitolerans]